MGKLNFRNVLTMLLPLVALIANVGVVLTQKGRVDDIDTRRQKTEENIAAVEAAIKRVDESPSPPRMPTMEQSPREQVDFLNMLRAFASASAVKVDQFNNSTPVAPSSGSGTDASKTVIPGGVLAISSSVEISGPYNNVRSFMYDLLRSPRLFSVNDLQWTRGMPYPKTVASFTLTRYVTPAPVGVAANLDQPQLRSATDVSGMSGPGPLSQSNP